MPHSPLFYHDLKYADAKTVKGILDETVGKFGTETEASKVGGVRGIDKYIKPMIFTEDPANNRIIVRGDYQDNLIIKDLIQKIDQPQPQIAIEVLILQVTVDQSRTIGSQIRTKITDCNGPRSVLGTGIQYQTSGLNSNTIVERTRTSGDQNVDVPDRLMGDLINLAKGLPAGNTILTLGSDLFGVWGIFQIIDSFSSAQIVANPFLLASNKQKATVKIGEIRRIVSSQTVTSGTSANLTTSIAGYSDDEATLTVEMTPLVNSDGMVTLDLRILVSQFLPGGSSSNVAKTIREIVTRAIVADREVLALGGLIQNTTTDDLAKVPILGDVPVLGWLFKNRTKGTTRSNLIVLISIQLIDPRASETLSEFSTQHVNDYYATLDNVERGDQVSDPIYRMFFDEGPKSVDKRINSYLFTQSRKRTANSEKRIREMEEGLPYAEEPDEAERPIFLEQENQPKASPTLISQNQRSQEGRTKISLMDGALDNQETTA